jgi:hypothetical protein
VRRKKQYDLSELQTDEHFPFYVGRLVGAAEVTSNWLVMQQGSEYQEMGRGLGAVVAWFLPNDGHTVSQDTLVLPPKAGK